MSEKDNARITFDKEKLMEFLSGTIGSIGGACVGVVVKHGLDMITPPGLKAAEKAAFGVGKYIISAMITGATAMYVQNEIDEGWKIYSDAKEAYFDTKKAIEETALKRLECEDELIMEVE